MPSKHLVAVVLVVCVCLGVATVYVWRGGQTAQTGENAQVAENFEVVYSVSGGFAGGLDIITIKNDGTILENSDVPPFVGEKAGKITEDELQEFKELIINADVFDLENSYGGIIYDGILTSITFTIGAQSKTISTYYSENLPENLTLIIQKISEFKNSL